MAKTSHSVRRHLRLDVGAYDETIRRFIPAYDRMIARAAAEAARVGPAVVVDLGAGSGALSAALLARPEVGRVVALDLDPEMLDQARARLGHHGDRVSFMAGSFFDPLPPCGALTASLTLHHVPGLDEKTQLFRHLRGALSPGGVLVVADVMVPADGPLRDATFRTWADHLVSSGIEEEQAWRHFEEWSEEDTYHPVDAEVAALTAAGFDARCVWRDEPSTVLVAVRSDDP